MNTSAFDPSVFMDATTTDALVRRPPLPINSEWIAIIQDIETVSWESKKPDAKVRSGFKFNVKVELDALSQPQIKELTGADKIVIEDGIMLETTPQGMIDWGMGKNSRLRTYREALGMNVPGQAFSPRMMIGRPIRVKISHREYQGEFFDQIAAVAKP